MGVVSPADMNGAGRKKYARVERERRYLLRELPPGLERQTRTRDHGQLHHGDAPAPAKGARTRGQRVDAQAHAEARARAARLSRTFITNIYL